MAIQGVGGRPKYVVLPVSTKRTTNGLGGTRSFRRPSAIASFCATSSGEISVEPKARRTTLTTTGEAPSGASRRAK